MAPSGGPKYQMAGDCGQNRKEAMRGNTTIIGTWILKSSDWIQVTQRPTLHVLTLTPGLHGFPVRRYCGTNPSMGTSGPSHTRQGCYSCSLAAGRKVDPPVSGLNLLYSKRRRLGVWDLVQRTAAFVHRTCNTTSSMEAAVPAAEIAMTRYSASRMPSLHMY